MSAFVRSIAIAAVLAGAFLPAGPVSAANPHANGHGNSGGGIGGRNAGGHLTDGVVGPAELAGQTSVAHTQVTDDPDTPRAGTRSLSLGLASWSHGSTDSLRVDSWEVLPAGAGYAFTDHLVGTLSATPFGVDRVRALDPALSGSHSGAGAFGAVLKLRVTGTDSSLVETAVAIHVSRPVVADSGTGRAEFGVRAPVQVQLPGEVALRTMAEIDRRNDPDGLAQHTECVGSASLSRDLVPHVSGFVEVVGVTAPGTSLPGLSAFDTGLYVEPVKHAALGLGVSFGRSAGRRDTGVFVGAAFER
jgi:hypothetical protein